MVTTANLIAFFVLAVAGAMFLIAGGRILKVLRKAQAALTIVETEHQAATAQLNLAKREERRIKSAIDEASGMIEQIARTLEGAEAQLARTGQADHQSLNLLDREWKRRDRLFRARITNPSVPQSLAMGAPGVPVDGNGILVHGYARTDVGFRDRVLTRFNASAGFVVDGIEEVSLS